MLINKEVGKRIAMLRFLMIFGIIMLHTPPHVDINNLQGSAFYTIIAFFQSAVFRSTVPLLTFISGYLLFSSGADLNVKKLLQKKGMTLGVPFLVFNLGLLAIVYLLQQRAHAAVMYEIYLPKANAVQWVNAALGVTASPINYPLYFLRDMCVIILISPAMGMFLRQSPMVGLVLLFTFFMYNVDGDFVLRNNMPINFYLGGLIAIWKVDSQRLDRHAKLFLGVFIGACGAMVLFKVRNTNYLGFVAPVLIWPAASLIVNTRFGTWAAKMGQYSFFMFIAHAPLVAISWKMLPAHPNEITLVIYWVAAPVLITTLLVNISRMAMYLAPKSFALITGARVKPPFVERRNWATRPAVKPVAN